MLSNEPGLSLIPALLDRVTSVIILTNQDSKPSERILYTMRKASTLPLVIITAGIDEWKEGFPSEIAGALEQNWRAMQKEVVALSHNSKHIIATESDHSFQDCQPELVVDVIRQLVQQIRKETLK